MILSFKSYITVIIYLHFSCWLNEGHDKVIERVNRRMTALTGLNLETAEDFQVIPSLLVSFPCFSSVAIKQNVWQQNYH